MSSVLVRLLPAARASDYQQFRSTLDDPSLADEGIAVQTWGALLLLVPVDDRRRGGYYSAATWSTTLQVWLGIRRRTGFPRTRIRWSRSVPQRHLGRRTPARGRQGARPVLRLQRDGDQRLPLPLPACTGDARCPRMTPTTRPVPRT